MKITLIMKIFILFLSSIVQFSLVTSQNKSNVSYIIIHPELSEKYNLDSGWLQTIDYPHGNENLSKLVTKAPLFVPSDMSASVLAWLNDISLRFKHPTLTEEEKEGSTYLTNYGQTVRDYTTKIGYVMKRPLYKDEFINSLSCKIGQSKVYLASNSNFKDGFILFNKIQPKFFSVVIAPLKMKPTYERDEHVAQAFREIIDVKVRNYTLNEVEKLLFSRSWFDQAQLCISLIPSENKFYYRNIELDISKIEIKSIAFEYFRIPITVLCCKFTCRENRRVPIMEHYIFPHPDNKNKIFMLYSNFKLYPVKEYIIDTEN